MALLLALPTMARAADQTAREFLAQCDHFDPNCRTEFVAGLQAVHSGGLACPPQIDVNTPISPWLDYMHRRVLENPDCKYAPNIDPISGPAQPVDIVRIFRMAEEPAPALVATPS